MEEGLCSILVPPQLFYLLTGFLGTHLYSKSVPLDFYHKYILSQIICKVRLYSSLANPLAKRKALFYLTMKTRGSNKWRSGESNFMHSTVFARVDHFSLLPLVLRAKPGAHFVPLEGTPSYFLWCGCWEVNFSLAPLSACIGCLSGSSFLRVFSIRQQVQRHSARHCHYPLRQRQGFPQPRPGTTFPLVTSHRLFIPSCYRMI